MTENPETTRRATLITSLRAFADFLETHPSVQAPPPGARYASRVLVDIYRQLRLAMQDWQQQKAHNANPKPLPLTRKPRAARKGAWGA